MRVGFQQDLYYPYPLNFLKGLGADNNIIKEKKQWKRKTILILWLLGKDSMTVTCQREQD